MDQATVRPAPPLAPAPHALPAEAAPAADRWERMFLLLVIAVGVLYRLLQYMSDRSVWMDEALAAQRYIGRTPAEILRPDVFGGVAPGFYLVQWAATQGFGTSELALRLPSILAGLGSIFLFNALARRFLDARPAVLATAIFAVSPNLIYFSSEAKRYSLDVFVALAVLTLACEVHRRGGTWKSVGAFVAGCLAAVFFSFPAAILSAGATLGLAWVFAREGNRAGARAMGMVAGGGALVVALPLWRLATVQWGTAGSRFWASGYMPFPPRSGADLAWLPMTYLRTFADPLGLLRGAGPLTALNALAGACAFAAGVLALRGKRPSLLPVLLLPLVVALAGSAMHLYPFGGSRPGSGRAVLYLMPVFLIMMAAGVGAAWRSSRLPLRAAGWLAAALLVLPPLADDVAAVPYGRSEARSILAYVAQHRQPTDVVYIHHDIQYPFGFYRERLGFTGAPLVMGACDRLHPARYLAPLGRLPRGTRVWLVFADGAGAYGWNEKAFVLRYMESIGVVRDDRAATGTSAHLYEIHGPVPGKRFDARIPVFPPGPDQFCDAVSNE